jgi:hypothetical protein
MKNLYIFLLLMVGVGVFGQNGIAKISEKSPGGFFDKVFDQYGNNYSMSTLEISKSNNNANARAAIATCSEGSMFDLYFEQGSGMEIVGDAAHDARRAVICRVFKDLSDFINSPLKNLGNTTKVKIWVRNIANLGAPPNALGLATAFYNMPTKNSTGFGGIADNEVWKTIHAGVDSYTNVTIPVSSSNTTPNPSGFYYHGMMAFNFNGINWNTNLAVAAPINTFDLYSVMLHEVTHALGFASLIDSNGKSKFGDAQNYYSRYDRFLKNNASSQFLITNSTACSNMYNYGFNPALNTSVLQPNTASCNTNQTTCSSAVKFVGTSTTPVYTSNCFEGGSSLSHFEDQCVTPNINDAYFLMSNGISNGSGGSVNTKRFLRPEERNALSDIGYSLNTTYGNNANVSGSFNNYGGTISTGINIAGINDGINNLGFFTFIGKSGIAIPITSILSNDYAGNPSDLRFECLQDVFDTTATLSATTGSNSTLINFNSTISGIHLLRYVPYSNITGQRGNITYIYVYVLESNNCATPNTCNLVSNGDFEEYSGLPTNQDQISLACNWNAVSAISSTDYYHANATNRSFQIPCNVFGDQTDKKGLNGYMGMWTQKRRFGEPDEQPYYETVRTELTSPLLPNTTYTLSFDVSLAEAASANSIKFQAYLSPTLFVGSSLAGTIEVGYFKDIPISNPAMLFTNPTFSTTKDGWETITFTFTTGAVAGEKYLYLGALSNNVQFNAITPAGFGFGCNYPTVLNEPRFAGRGLSYYFVDNVELKPLAGAVFNLPSSICSNGTLPDLRNYLSAVNANGVFIGNGVVNTAGVYSFNATSAGSGLQKVTYTYLNNLGCSSSITMPITVNPLNIVPTFNPITICEGAIFNLPTISNNGVSGTWSPAFNNTLTGTYLFTPSGSCNNSTTSLTVVVNKKITPTFSGITTSICSGTTAPTLPTTSTNGIVGTWLPAVVSNTISGSYVFAGNTNYCASQVTVTITVLPATNPSCVGGGVCIPNLTLTTAETNTSFIYKRINWIETKTNYATAASQNITMKAGNYVVLKAGSYIKAGSLYQAKIEACTASSRISNQDVVEEKVSNLVRIFPNPTKGSINIVSENSNIKSIVVSSLEGKSYFVKNALNSNEYQIEATHFQDGIYIMIIETADGKITRQKLIKN